MSPRRKPSNSVDSALSPSAIMNEGDGPSQVVDPSSPTFKQGDLVLCEYNGQRYPAKILEVSTSHKINVIKASRSSSLGIGAEDSVAEGNSGLEENQVLFFMHYIRWNQKWNEWVPVDRLFKFERKPELKVGIMQKLALKLRKRTQIAQLRNSIKALGLNQKSKLMVKQEPQSPQASIADDVSQHVVKCEGKKRLKTMVKVEQESPLRKHVIEREVTIQCLDKSNPDNTSDNIASAGGSFKTHQSSSVSSTSEDTQDKSSSPQVLIKERETPVKEEPLELSESFEEHDDLHLTENLINVLLLDKDRIQENMFVADSCPSVNDVLVEYVTSVEQSEDICAISRAKSFISGLRMLINAHAWNKLLYDQERFVVGKKLGQGLPEELGAVYLLRLLIIFDKLLQEWMPQGCEDWKVLINEKVLFIRFLESRSALYFPSSLYVGCAIVEES